MISNKNIKILFTTRKIFEKIFLIYSYEGSRRLKIGMFNDKAVKNQINKIIGSNFSNVDQTAVALLYAKIFLPSSIIINTINAITTAVGPLEKSNMKAK